MFEHPIFKRGLADSTRQYQLRYLHKNQNCYTIAKIGGDYALKTLIMEIKLPYCPGLKYINPAAGDAVISNHSPLRGSRQTKGKARRCAGGGNCANRTGTNSIKYHMKENYDILDQVKGLNYVELTPISFLQRASEVYANHPGIIYGNRTWTWKEVSKRCRRLADGLKNLEVKQGDTVSIMAANTPELAEAHFGVPMSGGVLNAINTRLDADTVAYILAHSDARVLITDTHFSNVVSKALSTLDSPPVVIDIVDSQAPAPQTGGERLGSITYEELLAQGDENSDWGMPESEWDALTLNYTSGTSGRPKGVVYHHRGSYLMSMGTVAAWQIPKFARYLVYRPDVPLQWLGACLEHGPDGCDIDLQSGSQRRKHIRGNAGSSDYPLRRGADCPRHAGQCAGRDQVYP